MPEQLPSLEVVELRETEIREWIDVDQKSRFIVFSDPQKFTANLIILLYDSGCSLVTVPESAVHNRKGISIAVSVWIYTPDGKAEQKVIEKLESHPAFRPDKIFRRPNYNNCRSLELWWD